MKKKLARKPDGTFDGQLCLPAQRRLLDAYVVQGVLTADDVPSTLGRKSAAEIIKAQRAIERAPQDKVLP
jgi:hypothetical protein